MNLLSTMLAQLWFDMLFYLGFAAVIVVSVLILWGRARGYIRDDPGDNP